MQKTRNKFILVIIAMLLFLVVATLPFLISTKSNKSSEKESISLTSTQSNTGRAVEQVTSALSFATNTGYIDLLERNGYRWENNTDHYILTLNSLDMVCTGTAISVPDNTTIVLEGNNKIVSSNTSSSGLELSAIKSLGNLQIKGNGNLQIVFSGSSQNHGISTNGTLEFSTTGNIVINGSAIDSASYTAINKLIDASKPINIKSGNFTLHAKNGKSSYGIHSETSVTISGGNFNIEVEQLPENQYAFASVGIFGFDGVNIEGIDTNIKIKSRNTIEATTSNKILFTDVHPLQKSSDGEYDVQLQTNTTLYIKDSDPKVNASEIEILSKAHYGYGYTSVDENNHALDCICTDSSSTPHTFNDGEVIKQATNSETGLKKYSCTTFGCNGEKQEIIPLLAGGSGNNNSNNKTAPTRLSAEVILVITVIAVVIVGGGGFCLFLYVLRPFLKKRKEERIQANNNSDNQENDSPQATKDSDSQENESTKTAKNSSSQKNKSTQSAENSSSQKNESTQTTKNSSNRKNKSTQTTKNSDSQKNKSTQTTKNSGSQKNKSTQTTKNSGSQKNKSTKTAKNSSSQENNKKD